MLIAHRTQQSWESGLRGRGAAEAVPPPATPQRTTAESVPSVQGLCAQSPQRHDSLRRDRRASHSPDLLAPKGPLEPLHAAPTQPTAWDRPRQSAGRSDQRASGALTAHMRAIKGDVAAARAEVDRLSSAVTVVEDGCRLAGENVTALRARLASLGAQRAEAAAAMRDFMDRAGAGIERVRRDMELQDAELARLTEQNNFMRLWRLERAGRTL